MHDPNSRRFWLAIGALTVLCVPFPFAGATGPLLFGLPVWFWITVAAAIALVVVTIRSLRRWNLSALDADCAKTADE